MSDTLIIGAGLSGLIASYAWSNAQILEASPEPTANHTALLRFRSDVVSRLTGIPFRKVRVRKAIAYQRQLYNQCDIVMANLYSMKCLGGMLADRSIWDLESVDRYVAPDDFIEQLQRATAGRVQYNTKVKDLARLHESFNVISTIPLPLALEQCLPDELAKFNFRHEPINVHRFIIPRCDLYQTIYFVDPDFPVYRASITGRTMIIESVGELQAFNLSDVFAAFGLSSRVSDSASIDVRAQRFGKIASVPDDMRKHALFRLTTEFGIFSLGRFATWRNILLDDVVQDIDVVRRMMTLLDGKGNNYDLARATIST